MDINKMTRKQFEELDCFKGIEEFDEQKFVWFVDKNKMKCCLYYINCTNKIFINVNGDVINIGELNKENYLKACEMAKKLFLGGIYGKINS